MKRENDDAEFVQNLNNSFKKERGFQIKLNPDSEGKCSKLPFLGSIISDLARILNVVKRTKIFHSLNWLQKYLIAAKSEKYRVQD